MMRALYILIISLFASSSILAQSIETYKKFTALRFEKNIELEAYSVHRTYQLDDGNFIVIAYPKVHDSNNEGLRLILLKKEGKKHHIAYISKGVAESYIYKPSFYKHKENIIIVCEQGAEYTWGLDAFLYQNQTIKKLGHMNIGIEINKEEHQVSAIPVLNIYQENEILNFVFKPISKYESINISELYLFYQPGMLDKRISLNEISYSYDITRGWLMHKKFQDDK